MVSLVSKIIFQRNRIRLIIEAIAFLTGRTTRFEIAPEGLNMNSPRWSECGTWGWGKNPLRPRRGRTKALLVGPLRGPSVLLRLPPGSAFAPPGAIHVDTPIGVKEGNLNYLGHQWFGI